MKSAITQAAAALLLSFAFLTLTSCGGGGSTLASTVAVLVSPSSAQLAVSNTQQFTATVTGASNTAVTWSVNGTVGGNNTVGAISSSGFFTVPATVPNPSAVTVTATSVADTTKSASAEVTITALAPSGLPQINSLSQTTANPFDLLTITGSGFDSTAMVNISSTANGFSANIQPVVVSETSLVMAVPVLSNGSTFSRGAANLMVVQSSGQSNSTPLQIAGLPPAPPLAPGTVTLGFLQAELAIAQQLNSEVTPSPLPSDLAALISALNAVIPPIEAVVNGAASSANLGSLNGQPVILGETELAQMDKLSLALLQAMSDSSGPGSSSGATSRTARLGNSIRVRVAPFAQSSSTDCISSPAVAGSIFDVSSNGRATAKDVAADLVYLNQGLGASPEAAKLMINTLKLAPTAIVVVAKSTTIVLFAPEVVTAAEIYGALADVFTIMQYKLNPAPTGDDKVELLAALIGRAELGLAGDIATLLVGVGNLQSDYHRLPQGIPPNPQAAACVSALSLDFGTVGTGITSPAQKVTLKNNGPVPLTVLPLVVDGPNAADSADFQETDKCAGTLEASASCTIMVTFKPSTGTDEAAAIGINGTSPALPININLFGSGGTSASPVVEISAATATEMAVTLDGAAIKADGDAGNIDYINQIALGNHTLSFTCDSSPQAICFYGRITIAISTSGFGVSPTSISGNPSLSPGATQSYTFNVSVQ
jgi:hypothetical protein